MRKLDTGVAGAVGFGGSVPSQMCLGWPSYECVLLISEASSRCSALAVQHAAA